MNKTIFTAAVLLVLAGCNDDKEQTKPAPGEGKITVTAGIEALTRAPHLNEDGSGYFQDGDKIALTVSGGDKTVRKEYTIGGFTGKTWACLRVRPKPPSPAAIRHPSRPKAPNSPSTSRPPRTRTCCWLRL